VLLFCATFLVNKDVCKRPQQSAIPNCPTAGHGSKYQRVLGDRRPVELYTPTDRQSFGQILLIVSSKAPRQLYTRRRVTTASADKSTDRRQISIRNSTPRPPSSVAFRPSHCRVSKRSQKPAGSGENTQLRFVKHRWKNVPPK